MAAVLIVAIVVILALAVLMVVVTGRRRASTGTLSRETRKSDVGLDDVPKPASDVEADASTEGRERAEETRALGSGSSVPAPSGARTPATRVPIDDEELGVSRRQFFNRATLVLLGAFGSFFGLSLIAFLWPTAAGGFGGKISIGTDLKTILAQIADKKEPFYSPEARTYINPYPKADLPKAKKVYLPAIYTGMEQYGIVALYQKCVHLGCKVPWCDSSQWFECPCHGSKYNRVGEKRGGPAPRGLDRFAVASTGSDVIVDTSVVFTGPPIGTDTTGQGAEGPLCVS